MTWRCSLIQKRLPAFGEGESTGIWRLVIARHLKTCPRCQQELQELKAVERLYQQHPLPDPGPEFWSRFEEELHRKLVRLSPTEVPEPRRLRLPHYLAGATALAGILAVALYLGPFSRPVFRPSLTPAPEGKVPGAEAPRPSPPQKLAEPAAKPRLDPVPLAAPREPVSPALRSPAASEVPAAPGTVSLARGHAPEEEEEDLLAEEDFLNWDLESLVGELSPEERQVLRERLEMRR